MVDHRYDLIERIGRGGFGEVHRARQVATGQAVALKLLSLRYDGPSVETQIARFRREMQLCAELNHPNIVRLIDFGEKEDQLYIVFELVPGRNLADVLRDEGAMDPREAFHLMGQVLDAIGCAHAMGVVHRDLKPHNIMVTSTGLRRNAMVLDFGIGAVIEAARGDDFTQLTATHELLGTPAYAAPEQLRGEAPTPRSDLYAWALVLLECLTGQRVMRAENLLQTVALQVGPKPVEIPTALRQHWVGQLLSRALAKEVVARDVTAAGLLREIERQLYGGATLPVLAQPQLPDAEREELESSPTAFDRRQGTLPSGELSGTKHQVSALCCRLSAEPLDPDAGELDPEAHDALLRAQQELCAEIANRYDGQIAGGLGDLVLIQFGYPRAREDDARRAGQAALALLRESALRSERLEEHEKLRLVMRIGLHEGPVIGDGGGMRDVVGVTTAVAAELSELADPDTAFASSEIWGSLRRSFTGEPEGKQRVPTRSRPIGLIRLTGARDPISVAALGEPGSKLIGRDHELALLQQRWAQARTGAGQGALVIGEAGIGKSRLAGELRRAAADQEHSWLEGRCAQDNYASALRPFVDLLESLFGFEFSWDSQRKAEKLEVALRRFGFDIEATLPVFARLLGVPSRHALPQMSPEDLKELTLQAIVDLLFELAAQQPLMLVVEDLHWADPTTLELIGRLLADISAAPVLLLLTARPEFSSSWPQLLQVQLSSLDASAVAGVIAGVTKGKILPPQILQQVVQRTDGVPLFIEELTRMLLESEVLAERDDRFELLQELDDRSIPGTLRSSLVARLERQGPALSTAQLAAALGREFRQDLLIAASALDSKEVQTHLDSLVAADLMYRRRRMRSVTYVFKHALVRDAAYESMLKPAKREAHARVAGALERDFPELVELRPELLADHLAAAGRHREAITYAQRAGQAAIERSANAEAILHAERALGWLDALEDGRDRWESELALNGILTSGLMSSRGWVDPMILRTVERSSELVGRLGDSPYVEPTLWASLLFHHCRGHRKTARQIADRLRDAIEEEQNVDKLVFGLPAVANCMLAEAPSVEMHRYLERALSLYDYDSHRHHAFVNGMDSRSYALMTQGLGLWLSGAPDAAVRALEACRKWSQKIEHYPSLTLGLIYEAIVYQQRGQTDQVIRCGQQAIETAEKYRLHGQAPYGLIMLSWARRDLETLTGQLDFVRSWGYELALSYYCSLAVDVELSLGRTEAAQARLEEIIAKAEQSGELYYLPELKRMKARMLCDRGESQQAEALLRSALAEAERYNEAMVELRIAVDLFRLLQASGSGEEALELLVPRYEAITEGRDTAFLRDVPPLLS